MAADSPSKRDRILFGVWAVISEKGVGGVSVRAVAAAAGVSAGLVQHYFPTRDTLIRESARHMVEAAATQFPAPTDPQSDDHAAAVSLLIHPLESAAEHSPGTGVFYAYLAEGATDPEIRAVLEHAKSDARAELSRRLDCPESVANRLLGLSDGLTLQVFLGALSAKDARALLLAELNTELNAL